MIKSNKIISKLVIGGANFKNKYGINNKHLNQKKLNNILNYALKNNILQIDNAEAYDSIEEINKFSDVLKSFRIDNKISNPKENQHHFFNYFYKNLEIINCKQYNIFYIHNIDVLRKSYKNLLKDIFYLRDRGFINHIGVSIYEINELKKILKIFTPNYIQVPVNLLDSEFLLTKNLSFIKKNKIKIIGRSLFLQGLLLTKKEPTNLKLKNIFNHKNNIFKKNKYNLNTLELCVVPFLKNKNIDKLIIGVESKDHIQMIKNIENKLNEYPKINLDFFKYDKKDKYLLKPKNW